MNVSFPSAHLLKNHFINCQKRNRHISVRWLSQRLSISPSYTSMILNGKRPPSLAILKEFCRLLDVDRETEDQIRIQLLKYKFADSADENLLEAEDIEDQPDDADWALANKAQFVALRDWHYFAIMQTMLLKNYDGSVEFISDFLGMEHKTVETAICELEEVDLVVKNPKTGVYTKANSLTKFQSRDRDLLKNHHIRNMEKSIEILQESKSTYNKENRLVTSSCFSCRSQDLPLIKQKIAQLLTETANTDEKQGHDEVCFLLVQLIPLSQK